jgi:glycosyltransferase involved in cell wall biosynthesis
MKHPLSVYLIAGNEEAYITRCLQSFKPFAEELVVCIARGALIPDKTEEIARNFGAKVVFYENIEKGWNHIDDFASARNTALNACSNEWAIWTDADDIATGDAGQIINDAITKAIETDKDLIAFRYDVENAGLTPLREMASRKGSCRWKNKVHEALEPLQKDRIMIVDKAVRIHKPHGYKKESADRNHKILTNETAHTPYYVFYQHQEYFLSGKYPEAINKGKLALAFDYLDETLRYEILCNLGRCSDNSERIKYLGKAISIQPDRREAYYYLATQYASTGNWVKCYSSIKSCMVHKKPAVHYWTQVNAIYDWQALDLYRTACYCVGQKEEGDNIYKKWPVPKISIIHATKGRSQQAFQRRIQWLNCAKSPLEIEWIFCVDHTDKGDYIAHNPLRVFPEGIINAWNQGARTSKGNIIIQMSDDWTPVRHWDALICSKIGDSEAEKVLAISDGQRTDKLICMAILTRKRLLKQGNNLFHPDYQKSDGIYSDNEFTQRAYDDEVVVEAKDIVFTHEHPFFGHGKADEQMLNHNKKEFYEMGRDIYEKRKEAGWPQ